MRIPCRSRLPVHFQDEAKPFRRFCKPRNEHSYEYAATHPLSPLAQPSPGRSAQPVLVWRRWPCGCAAAGAAPRRSSLGGRRMLSSRDAPTRATSPLARKRGCTTSPHPPSRLGLAASSTSRPAPATSVSRRRRRTTSATTRRPWRWARPTRASWCARAARAARAVLEHAHAQRTHPLTLLRPPSRPPLTHHAELLATAQSEKSKMIHANQEK